MVYFIFFFPYEQWPYCLCKSTNLYPITSTLLLRFAKSKGLHYGFLVQEWNLSIEKA